MAAITLDIAGNTRQLDRDIQKTVNRVYNINLKTKGDQPLGRITGKVNEFNKSLDASNARVIAFGASAGIIFGVERAFTALVSSTIEVQKSLQDINVILNVSAQNLQKFGGELFNIARNTGQSFQEVAKAATEFSRQGLGVEETLKRTNEALILSRLSGLDVAKSVESLTAAVNSFASQAVTATEVVNKFATVDAAFAVSSADLADAIARVGSSAAQSGVSLNELIAIVTSAQQTTARGGAVIGNSFKTIFTRLQREKVVDLLGSLGISGTNASGEVKSTIQLLQELGAVYDTLGSQQQAYVAEQVGGVFQINILKAALADLGKEYSIYSSALNVAAGATDQAIRRNEELNKTYSAQINALQENARQLAAAGGERLLGPSIDRLVGGTNTLLKGFSESDGQGVGAVLGKGILDGLGQFIAGPGLALIGGVLLKLFRDLAKFATGSVQQLLGLNTAATQQRDLQQSINSILAKNPQLLQLALQGEQGLNQAANSLLASLQKQTVELQKQAQVAAQISKAFVAQAGVRVAGGVPVVPTGRPGKAAGYVPNFASQKNKVAETIGAYQANYEPGRIYTERLFDGQGGSFLATVNSAESIDTVIGPNGNKGTFVIPPNGFAAKGFVPNFAYSYLMESFAGKKVQNPRAEKQFNKFFNKGGFGNVERDDRISTVGFQTIPVKLTPDLLKLYNEQPGSRAFTQGFEDHAIKELKFKNAAKSGKNIKPLYGVTSSAVDGYRITGDPNPKSPTKGLAEFLEVKGGGFETLSVANKFGRVLPENLGRFAQSSLGMNYLNMLFKEGVPDAIDTVRLKNILAVPNVKGARKGNYNRPFPIKSIEANRAKNAQKRTTAASGFIPNFAQGKNAIDLGNLDTIPNKLGNKVVSLIYPGRSDGYSLRPATASYLKQEYTGRIPVAGINQKKLKSQIPDLDKNLGDLLVKEANQFGQVLGGFNFLQSAKELPNFGAAQGAVGVAFEGGVQTLLTQKIARKQNAGIDFRNINPRLRSIFNNAPGMYDAKSSPDLTNEVFKKLLNETKPGATVKKTSGKAGEDYVAKRTAAVEQLRKEGVTGSVAIRQALRDRFGIVGKAAGYIPNFADSAILEQIQSKSSFNYKEIKNKPGIEKRINSLYQQYPDLQYLGSGAESHAFKSGNRVLKLPTLDYKTAKQQKAKAKEIGSIDWATATRQLKKAEPNLQLMPIRRVSSSSLVTSQRFAGNTFKDEINDYDVENSLMNLVESKFERAKASVSEKPNWLRALGLDTGSSANFTFMRSLSKEVQIQAREGQIPPESLIKSNKVGLIDPVIYGFMAERLWSEAKAKTGKGFASGFIPNFAAIQAPLQNAVNNEIAAGALPNQVRIDKNSKLKTSLNPDGLGVWSKKYEGSLPEGIRMAEKAGINPKTKGMPKAGGYIPNFAIEDPDIQGASPETATAAIISAISGVAFAFAFTGNQFRDSLKELTIATKATASAQRNQLAKDIRERRNLGAPNAAIRQSLAAERAAAKQAGTPGIIAKGATFGRTNALGLSIAAPILGEVIKNAVGQETAGSRQFGAVASGAGQIGSFAATGALIAKGGGPIGLAIGALLTIPGIVNEFTTEMPELAAAAKKASQDLTKFSDVSQRLLAASSSLSEFTDKGASPEKLKKVQDDFAKALAELTPAERARIESSIKVGNLEEELARITQERIDQERLKTQAVAVRGIAEKKGFLGLPSAFDPNTAQGKLDEETIRGVFKGFFTGKTPEETLANFNKAAQSGVPQLQNLQQAVAQLERDINAGTAGRRNLYGTLEGPDYREEFTRILEGFIPQGKTADEQEARSRFIKDLVSIADNDIKTFQNILQIPIKSLTRDRQQLEEGIQSAKRAAESTAIFNKVKEKYTGIIDNSISSLNRTIATFNALANALDKFQVNEESFEREQGVDGLGLRKNIAETALGPEAELTRRAALFEKIAQNEANRLDAIDQSNLTFRENFRDNLKDVFTERAGEIATTKGQTATTIPEQARVANEVLRAVKLFESGAVDINKILEDSFKDGAIDPDQFKTALGAAFQAAEFKTPATNKILDSILSVAEEQNTNLLGINQKASQENIRAAQEFANDKILLDIRRSLQVFGGIERFLEPSEEGIVKPLETLIKSATGQLQSQRGFEFARRTGAGTSFGTEAQVQNNIALGQSALNFITQLQDLSGGAFTPDPGSELYNRAIAGLTQSFQSNISKLNDILQNPQVDEAFKVQIKSALESIGGLGSSREIAQLQIAKETGSAFQSTLEGTLSRLQDPAIQQLEKAGLYELANEVANSAKYTSDPIVNVLSVQRGIQVGIATQLDTITAILNKPRKGGPTPSQTVSPPIEDSVDTNAKGFIPAFNKERAAISRGVGGAKAGDRPQFIPNLNGNPAFVNSGEQLVDNYMGSRQTAVLTRDMQNAMIAAKGFIPNFTPPAKIIESNEYPKEKSFKTIQGKVVQDLTDTGRNYIVIRSETPLDESFVGREIPFGSGKQTGKIISIDPDDRFSARVGELTGEKVLPPVKDNPFSLALVPKQKQNLTEKEIQERLKRYNEALQKASRYSTGDSRFGTPADAAEILKKLQRAFASNSQNYSNLDNNSEYKAIKDTVEILRNRIRATNSRAEERPQDPEFLKFLEEQSRGGGQPRIDFGPTGKTPGEIIAEAIVDSTMEPIAARATRATPEDLYTDALLRSAQVTAALGKYTGVNIGGNNPFGLANEKPKAKINPQKGGGASAGEFTSGMSEFVEFYDKNPGINTFFNEATHVNQNVLPGSQPIPSPKKPIKNMTSQEFREYTKSMREYLERDKSPKFNELLAIEEYINQNGGPNKYVDRLIKIADFLEQQNKSAQNKFLQIADIEQFGPTPDTRYSGANKRDRRIFGDTQGNFTVSEAKWTEAGAKGIQERASTLFGFLSQGIAAGEITDKELGLLGIPLDVAKNIVAETIAIDKQLKEQKPYQPSTQKPTPPPSIPGIPPAAATVPPPSTVPKLPSKPIPKQPEPPAAVPGIQPAVQDTTPTITVRKPRKTPTAAPIIAEPEIPRPTTGYPGGISPETARSIVEELDATYNNAIRNQRNPQTAKAWAQTQQRYRLLYSRGQYAELDRFYKGLTKGPNYNSNYGQGTGRPGESVQRFAAGFIPNFAQEEKEKSPIFDTLGLDDTVDPIVAFINQAYKNFKANQLGVLGKKPAGLNIKSLGAGAIAGILAESGTQQLLNSTRGGNTSKNPYIANLEKTFSRSVGGFVSGGPLGLGAALGVDAIENITDVGSMLPELARVSYDNYQYEQKRMGKKKSMSMLNFGSGFIPNFAQDYISNLANLESGLSGKEARLTNIPGIGLAMINEDQPDGKFPSKDHPEGKMAAIRNSMKMQKRMGVMSKGYIPNFAVSDQSFAQQEASFTANTSALSTLSGGIQSLNSALANFASNLTNPNNTSGGQQNANTQQAGGQPNVTTTTNAPVTVNVTAEGGGGDIANAVGVAIQNEMPNIINRVREALGQNVPPTRR